MTVSEWLSDVTRQLTDADIATARLDCLVLLEDATGYDRAWLLSHPEHELQGSILEKLNTKIVQRAQHIPLAYLRGHAEFYGRDFIVTPHTLVPRPETETIIDLLKTIPTLYPNHQMRQGRTLTQTATALGSAASLRQGPSLTHLTQEEATVVDVGTGSGAIAVTVKLELPQARVVATDIDGNCLETARQNAAALGADITFLRGNLLEPLRDSRYSKFDTSILLCNLPYVPDNFQINTAATHEPRHALFGGPDGLDLYREMFQQISVNDWKPQYILTESLPPQHETLTGIAKASGYSPQQTRDFIQLFTRSR